MIKLMKLCLKRDGSCETMIWFLEPNTKENIVSCHETDGSCGTMIWFLEPNTTESIVSCHDMVPETKHYRKHCFLRPNITERIVSIA